MSPVDWDLAQRTAVRVSGREPFPDSYHYSQLADDFDELTAEAEELVAIETGLRSEMGDARARVADRPAWIRANIASFQRLLRPLTQKMEEKESSSGLRRLTGRFSALEVGVVLGWMSTRVLGQYDLLIIEDEKADEQDIVYYVGPNVLTLEKKHNFPPREFRLWLALHEVTHRAQFTGIPWLREHFLSLVDQTLDAVDPDPKRLMEAARNILDARRRGEDPLSEGGLPMLLASEEQQEVLGQVMGMMSLLEGHGDVTMDRAGADRVPGAERFGRVLRERRNSARGINKFFQKIIGLEAKLSQYAAGERFIEVVEAEGGVELVDYAWRGPESLPTMVEIREPEAWIQRVTAQPKLRPRPDPGEAMGDPLAAPRLGELLHRCSYPPAGTPVVCGVSGGQDSLALLALARLGGCEALAVYVDHGLRPETEIEAEVVRAAARRLGAGFELRSVEVGEGPNLEARSRDARHAALGPKALLGHTADDQAETVLLNLMRGAGMEGLAGMRRDGRRPLLDLRRSETREVCELAGLEPVEDPTNATPRFRRNRVRHELLPLLAAIAERDLTPLLCRQADLLREDAAGLTEWSAEIDPTDARAVAAAHPAQARWAIRLWLAASMGTGHPPDAAAVDRVREVAAGEAVATDVGSGWRVRRSAQRLLVDPPVE